MDIAVPVCVLALVALALTHRRTREIPSGFSAGFSHVPKVDAVSRTSARLGPGVVVVTMSEGDREFSEIALARMKAYCRRHGYRMTTYSDRALKFSRGVDWQWMKVPAMIEALRDPSVSAALWIDDDVFITNMTQTVEAVLDTDRSADIFIGKDGFYPDGSVDGAVVNSGVFLVRNTETARHFLDDVWSASLDNAGTYNTRSFHEQQIMGQMIQSDYSAATRICDFGVLQSYYSDTYTEPVRWKRGHFALHLAGFPNDRRTEIFTQIVPEDVVTELPYVGTHSQKFK